MAMRTSPPGLRISEGEVYYKLDREGASGFSMSNVKRPMYLSNHQRPNDPIDWVIWSLANWVVGQVHWTFDIGRLTFDI